MSTNHRNPLVAPRVELTTDSLRALVAAVSTVQNPAGGSSSFEKTAQSIQNQPLSVGLPADQSWMIEVYDLNTRPDEPAPSDPRINFSAQNNPSSISRYSQPTLQLSLQSTRIKVDRNRPDDVPVFDPYRDRPIKHQPDNNIAKIHIPEDRQRKSYLPSFDRYGRPLRADPKIPNQQSAISDAWATYSQRPIIEPAIVTPSPNSSSGNRPFRIPKKSETASNSKLRLDPRRTEKSVKVADVPVPKRPNGTLRVPVDLAQIVAQKPFILEFLRQSISDFRRTWRHIYREERHWNGYAYNYRSEVRQRLADMVPGGDASEEYKTLCAYFDNKLAMKIHTGTQMAHDRCKRRKQRSKRRRQKPWVQEAKSGVYRVEDQYDCHHGFKVAYKTENHDMKLLREINRLLNLKTDADEEGLIEDDLEH